MLLYVYRNNSWFTVMFTALVLLHDFLEYIIVVVIFVTRYGDIHPQNWRERLVALMCMIVECTKLIIILGNITALLTYKETKVSAFKYHLKVVQEHMVSYFILLGDIFNYMLFS